MWPYSGGPARAGHLGGLHADQAYVAAVQRAVVGQGAVGIELADSIAVVDRGRVIARGTSDELKAEVGGERLAITVVPLGVSRYRRAASR